MHDTTPYPKHLTCGTCGAQHCATDQDAMTAWLNTHHAEHEACGSVMTWTVVPLAALRAPDMEDLGGGLRAVVQP